MIGFPWTNWYVWTKIDKDHSDWMFNHTEEGHVLTDKPQPKHPSFTEQRNWKGQMWRRANVYRTSPVDALPKTV